MPSVPFQLGETYHRRKDIHGRFGGQMQGGMATPKDHPYIFLFTGESGAQYGYEDTFTPEGVYLYTGEGQYGEMQFVRANRALRDHAADGKKVLLFENSRKGHVRFLGECYYLGHHRADRPDRDGKLRSAIIFELEVLTGAERQTGKRDSEGSTSVTTKDDLFAKSLEEWRQAALAVPPAKSSPSVRRSYVYQRARSVHHYVLRRSEGRCEGCAAPAPFESRQGWPYLEPHHTQRVSDGGPDHPAWVIALCPNCHRRVHHGRDGNSYNKKLVERLRELEPA